MTEQQKVLPLSRREVGRVQDLDELTLAALTSVEPAPECDGAEVMQSYYVATRIAR